MYPPVNIAKHKKSLIIPNNILPVENERFGGIKDGFGQERLFEEYDCPMWPGNDTHRCNRKLQQTKLYRAYECKFHFRPE